MIWTTAEPQLNGLELLTSSKPARLADLGERGNFEFRFEFVHQLPLLCLCFFKSSLCFCNSFLCFCLCFCNSFLCFLLCFFLFVFKSSLCFCNNFICHLLCFCNSLQTKVCER